MPSARVSPIPSPLHSELTAAGEGLADNEDVLRSVLAGCGDCIKILDLDGRLQFMSEGGKRVMEVDDFGPLKGCPWPDFWAGDGNAEAKRAVEAAKAGGTGRFKGPANTVKGNPRHWDVQVSPIIGADGKPSHLLSISRDITEEWRAVADLKEAVERQAVLSLELQHRIKNTLAMVGAIANQTMQGDSVADAREAFAARLMTLSRAHDLLTQSNWASAPIRDVVEGALAAHRTGRRPDQRQRSRSASDRQAGAGARRRHPRTRHQRHQIWRAVSPRQRRGGVVRSTGRWRRNLPLHLDRERRPSGNRACEKRLRFAPDRKDAAE